MTTDAMQVPLSHYVRSPERVVAHTVGRPGVGYRPDHGFAAGVAVGALASPNYYYPAPYSAYPYSYTEPYYGY